jgi:hypothetical protein
MDCLKKPRIGIETPNVLSPKLYNFPTHNQIGEQSHKTKPEFDILFDSLPTVLFKGYIDGTMDFFDEKVEKLTGYPKNFDRRKNGPI